MAAKKRAKKGRRKTTPYAAKRIRELAGEHGWDPEHIDKVVAGKAKKP